MKKLVIFISLFVLSINLFAATDITSSDVFGHWTMAGSPYRIFNNISIASGQTLQIDPGVDVIFQGAYKLSVFGSLRAAGTSGLPVKFRPADTLLGWSGITFEDSAAGASDLSEFDYCDLSYIKGDGQFNIKVGRKLDINSCSFSHCTAGIYLLTITGEVRFRHCDIYDNYATLAVINLDMSTSKQMDFCIVHDNVSNRNICAISTYTLAPSATCMIENCDFYQNTSAGHGGATIFSGGNTLATIRNNKVHHNSMEDVAAITLYGGKIDVNRNLICNNEHRNSGFCGLTEGGGGIRLSENWSSVDYSDFTIRNNVIANNYTGFYGGGICVANANVKILNNTIVNNSVSNSISGQAAGIQVFSEGKTIITKNNILYNNKTVGTGALSNLNYSSLVDIYIFENNWIQQALSVTLMPHTALLFYSDTLTNIVGANPNFISPTLTSSFTENALYADFGLTDSSACINSGNTTSVSLHDTAYNNVNRTIGTKVDIGAHEFNSFCADTITGTTDICIGASTSLSHPISGGVWSSPHSPLFINIDASTGVVTGVSRGIATVYYKLGGCIAATNVHVHSVPTEIFGPDNVCMGSTVEIVSFPRGGVWTASNSSAIISSAGVVTPVYFGIDTFTYAYSGLCGTATITKIVNVDTLPNPIVGPSSICAGDTVNFTSSGSGSWVDMHFGPTTINTSTGEYYGSAPGEWEIAFYHAGTSCRVTKSIRVNSNPIIGGHSGYTCIGVPKHLTTSVTGGTWSTDDPSIATIDPSSGIALGISTGNTNVTYISPAGCIDIKILSVALCPTQVPLLAQKQTMFVYPNPATDKLSVSTPDISGKLEVLNMVGVRVAEKMVNGKVTSFDTRVLPRGIYIVAWVNENERVVQKVVLQ